jgi:hypothetical protein
MMALVSLPAYMHTFRHDGIIGNGAHGVANKAMMIKHIYM